MGEVLELRDVDVVRSGSVLLSGVTWSVEPDQRWVVLGPNGAGKTTLLALAAATSHQTRGSVSILGEPLGLSDVFELRPRIGVASALVADQVPADERVGDLVMSSAHAVLGRWKEAYDPTDVARARMLLDVFGVAGLVDRTFGTLSEGERKRTQIARALMADPELLLLDEPAAGLDLGARETLVRTLGRLARDPAAPTTVMVTHHVEEIPVGMTHALLLRRGSVLAAGPVDDVLTADALSECFSLPLALEQRAGRYAARLDGPR